MFVVQFSEQSESVCSDSGEQFVLESDSASCVSPDPGLHVTLGANVLITGSSGFILAVVFSAGCDWTSTWFSQGFTRPDLRSSQTVLHLHFFTVQICVD